MSKARTPIHKPNPKNIAIERLLDDLERPSAAARIVGYSAQHVRKLANAGRIAAREYHFGWLVSVTSLRDYAHSQGKRS